MASHSLPTHALTVITKPALPVAFEAELELASDFAKASKSKSTQAAYSSDFRIFDQWCRERGLTALPATPATVCAFLAQQAGLGKRASTLGRRLAAIGYFHRLANEPSPVGDETIKATLAGIRRSIGAAPVRKKAATSDIVLSMAGTVGGESLRQLRDRAILLIGFASAMRRSELVALNVADLEWTAEGVLIQIRRSKTDQEGMGASVAVPRGATACPVAALRAWIEASGITEGAVFRRIWNKRNQRVSAERLHGRAVAVIVKAGARRLGFDVATFGAHSLRSGLVTSAVKRGVSLLKICDQTRHKSIEMLRVYCRDAELFVGNAAAGLL
jgi:site-specific recombinase XerD